MVKIRVLLAGGPSNLADSDRVHDVESLQDTVKLSDGSGYEHFTHSGGSRDVDGQDLPVFRWVRRTKVAE